MSDTMEKAKEAFLKENEGATSNSGMSASFITMTRKIPTFIDGTFLSMKPSQYDEGTGDKIDMTIKVKASDALTRVKQGEVYVDGPPPKAGDTVILTTNKNLASQIKEVKPGAALFIAFTGKKKLKNRAQPMNVFEAKYKNVETIEQPF